MKGEKVIVRAFGNRPLLRRVWTTTEKAVFITNEEQFQLLVAGLPAIEPLGFPRKDVFKYNSKLAISMERLFIEGKWVWDKLIPWTAPKIKTS